MKSTTKSIIIIAILTVLTAISGCLDNNYSMENYTPNIKPIDGMMITTGVSPYSAEESNNTLVYSGQLLPTTDAGGYFKVIKMYDTAENNVCYITYNGISCLKKEVK